MLPRKIITVSQTYYRYDPLRSAIFDSAFTGKNCAAAFMYGQFEKMLFNFIMINFLFKVAYFLIMWLKPSSSWY